MKIQMTIQLLENIVNMAKGFQQLDSSLSTTIEFELKHECNTFLGSDRVTVFQKSGYAECNGKLLISNH